MSRVLVAMSGGVDSSVAALLLKEAGHEVVGVFMRNGVSGAGPARSKSCCSASDARDARAVADRLQVPFYSVDYAAEFSRLIDHFAAEYRRGRTPNPCVLCNQDLKFGHLFSLADAVGADAVATGHYARIQGGQLLRPRDRDKDQTYYLFGVARDALPRVHFPLGDLTKAEVRRRAAAAGLETADKPESMDICFVTSGDYRDVVRSRGGTGKAGVFLDQAGRVVGHHQGVGEFTVGQRRGLPALGKPYYVQEICPESGAVVLCPREGLLREHALVRGVHWLVDPPPGPGSTLRAQVKVRARSAAAPAEVRLDTQDPSLARVSFHEGVGAITPGQAAVFYRGDLVLGGGWLDRAGAGRGQRD
jgi:tRNA-uridine 2-sulfurtransferase